ncbi:dUTP diphosphatase [Mobiluncus mulieris]|nr:dUTP diphosphatase [Mobiluncus mulieris]MCV0001581.1 dUTP diphosphatase [Mobiluncus mulieris]
MNAIARSLSSDVSLRALAKDMVPMAPGITAETVGRYLELLQPSFLAVLR